MKKGFTLIEVILGIFLISLIAMVFIPMVSFSFKNIVYSQKFTKDLYADQEFVENEMEAWQEIDPTDPNISETINVFGVNIKGHKIALETPSSGDINIFLPKRIIDEDIPIIKSPPKVIKKNNGEITEFGLFDNTTLWVDEVTITPDTKAFFLMNIYRWYLTEETDIENTPSNKTNEYTIFKEWNEARSPVSLAESLSLNFIPNIKLAYNTANFTSLETDMGFSKEDMINRFGNRFIQYGVTPFSIAGRIGAEELSNYVYIEAPRIEIVNAKFITDENKFSILFKNDITDIYTDISNEQFEELKKHFELNQLLGDVNSLAIGEDSDGKPNPKVLLVGFTGTQDDNLPGNKLGRGAAKHINYGAITIWHNNKPGGEFIIE